jgi:acyl-CoA thioesterase-1
MEASLNRFVQWGYGAGRWMRNLGVAIVMAGAAQAETVTVAALGDSLTQGYGLLPEEGFVPQLEGWLREQGLDVVVQNAGVSGDTTAGGLSRVAWTLAPEVEAMIVALGGNDLLRGIDPAESARNLRGILEAAAAAEVEVLLVGMEAPSNYGPEFKAAFDGMYAALSEEFGTGLYPSFFAGLTAEGDLESARARFMQPDGIHPNAEGVGVIVEAMGPVVIDWLAP